MPRICLTADLHGTLPEIPDCDLLILAGDILPDHPIGRAERYGLIDNGASWQAEWADNALKPWLWDLADRNIEVIAIAGNHDFAFELLDYVPRELPWTYLEDETITVQGLKIHGTPWCPGLPRWAFHAEEPKMRNKLAKVPSGLDILITHGPPYGIADQVGPRFGGPKRVGNIWLNPVLDRRRPKLVVCGHIHEAYGQYRLEYGGNLYSVSHNDDAYCPDNPPVLIEEL